MRVELTRRYLVLHVVADLGELIPEVKHRIPVVNRRILTLVGVINDEQGVRTRVEERRGLVQVGDDGVGGFYLHTVALQLGSVNGATAALVVGETVVPGIIGVVFLGDSARPGLAWVVALGFIGAVAGAVAVAVFGAAGHQTTPETEPSSAKP